MKEKLENYIKWTLNVESLNHDTLMDYGKFRGKEDLARASFLIAQKALDFIVEDQN